MIGIVDYAISRARMIFAFILLSIAAGWLAYTGLPKEGSPNIDIPVLYVSVNYPGVSALDAERLLVKPLENKLKTLEGLKARTGIASEGHASVSLEFDFGFDKDSLLAEVRTKVNEAKAEFPSGAMEPRIIEVNTSQFPILNITLSGTAPERTIYRIADRMQEIVEGIPSVLEATLTGKRNELLEIIIDPAKLETFGVTTQQILNAVTSNNAVIAAGALNTDQGSFSVKVPGAIESAEDLYSLPLKVSDGTVVTVRDLAEIRRGFEDATSIARFNGEPTVALSVKKRSGENIIATVDNVRAALAEEMTLWPDALKSSVNVDYSLDEARGVRDMVGQLESSVLTAVCLVMIVVVAALGLRSAMLVAFAIPTSFLLCFALLAVLGMSVNNMVMFGLILAVGMLVDGAIVVTEYADKRRAEGAPPSVAFGEAARRMFWPIISSTATTLCAFLPMLFWPGMPGQFMRYLPITLIFVLTASLFVALIYLPITGVIVSRAMGAVESFGKSMRASLGWFGTMLAGGVLAIGAVAMIQMGAGMAGEAATPVAEAAQAASSASEGGRPGRPSGGPSGPPPAIFFVGGFLLGLIGAVLISAGLRHAVQAVEPYNRPRRLRSAFGGFLRFIVGNPVMPVVVLGLTMGSLFMIFNTYRENSFGTEFFVTTDPEVANLYVSARGNLSLAEKDRIMRVVEVRILDLEGVKSALTSVGGGGGGAGSEGAPSDAIGSIQFEFENWRERKSGTAIMEDIRNATDGLPGIEVELAERSEGPQQGKPIQLRLAAVDFDELQAATRKIEQHLNTIEGLKDVSTTLPLPGIEWQLDIDRNEAGKYGADVMTIGTMIQLVTRGAVVDSFRPDDSEDEIDIRARYRESARVADTLDQLRVQTASGLVPLSNFVERNPAPKLAEITRVDGKRVFTVSADISEGVNANEKIAELGEWLKTAELGAVIPSFVGDFEEQQESMTFLMQAFAGALGLMFIILLAQFNSFYNSVLVLIAVVFSVGGVLVGMLVMGQSFSIIMSGIGVVALAGIVVNNNIVLIDTYQEFLEEMEPLDAIVETGRARLRPVLLTTITTMAGLLPMMFAVSIDFRQGGISVGAPTALWWTQLATAIVFGLGFATLLTLVVTPSLLAMRIWYLGKLPSLGWGGIKQVVTGARSNFNNDRRLKSGLRITLKSLPKEQRMIDWMSQQGFAAPNAPELSSVYQSDFCTPSYDAEGFEALPPAAYSEELPDVEWVPSSTPVLTAARPNEGNKTEAAE